jgi:NitT/TauT family transport system substrate-binding protein
MKKRDFLRATSTAGLAAGLGIGVSGRGLAQGSALQKVICLTDAGPLGRHSFFYVAREKGYYRQEGLDVEIQGGRGSAATIREVGAGAAMFGFADAGTLIMSRAKENVPVKMMGVVYAKPPHGLMALRSSGIRSAKDLAGKTLADTSASSNYLLFPAYAIGQFMMGKPTLERRVPNDGIVFLPYQAPGLDFYSNVVIASDATFRDRPALAAGFMRATALGMRDAFANPQEAGAIMSKSLPLLDAGLIAAETALVKDLATTPETTAAGLGALNREKIQQTIEIMVKNFQLDRAVSVDDVAVMLPRG